MLINIHSYNIDNNNLYQIQKNTRKDDNIIVFKASSKNFETMFPTSFFDKILKEGINCAYTNVPLFPKKDFLSLKALESLNIPVELDFKYLQKFKDHLYSNEQKTLAILEKTKEKHPEICIKELIDELFPKSEQKVLKKQATVLTNALFIARKLPEGEFTKVSQILTKYYQEIFQPYNKKEFIYPNQYAISSELHDLHISDSKIKTKLLKALQKLPNTHNMPEAFIYTCKVKNNSSNNIILRFIKTIMASVDHIHPQAEQKKERAAKFDKNPKFWVTILTSIFINKTKSDTLFDLFLKQCKFPVEENLQKHINRLTEIMQKWKKEEKNEDWKKLSLYILTLKYELEKRAPQLHINVNTLKKSLDNKTYTKQTQKVKKMLDLDEYKSQLDANS